MLNSKKNGFIKSIVAVISVVLMLALMLTGCTDKDAQNLANNAQSAAQKAQESADKAIKDASTAQNAADGKLSEADLLKFMEAYPDIDAVSEQIATAIGEYVSAGKLTEKGEALLVKYVTIEALETKLKAQDDKLSALKTTIEEDLKKEIKGINDKLDAVVDTVLASEKFQNAINTAIDTYVKDMVNPEIAKVNSNIDSLKTLLVGANYDNGAVEGLIGTINAQLAELNSTLAAIQAKVDVENTVSEAIAAATTAMTDALRTHEKNYIEATEFIVANDAEFDKLLAEYEEKKAIYGTDANGDSIYELIVKNINENRVAFRRALTKGEAEEILESVISESAEQINLAQTLAAALDAVDYVDGYAVIKNYANAEDTTNSETNLIKAEGILATIRTQMSDDEIEEYVNAYADVDDDGESIIRDLEDEVTALRAKVDELKSIRAYIEENVLDLFTGFTNYDAENMNFASVMLDEAKKWFNDDTARDRDTLESEYNNAKVAYETLIETKFDGDSANPNTVRLIEAAAWTEYNAANARLEALIALDADAAEWTTNIEAELAKYAYTSDGRTCYLYSAYETLNTYMTGDLKTFIETNFADAENVDAVIATYSDLVYAVAYSNDMTVNFYNTSGAVITLMDQVIGFNNAYTAENNSARYKALGAYISWRNGNKVNSAYGLDNENHNAILTEERVNAFNDACLRMQTLETAANNAAAINSKIDALLALKTNGTLTVNTMRADDGIREVRNDIVKWLNDYQIAVLATEAENDILINWILNANAERDTQVYAVTTDYIKENWDIIKHAELLEVLVAYNAIVEEVIASAELVVDKYEAIVADPDSATYILYFYADIKDAMVAYTGWAGKYNVEETDLDEYDFGENYKDKTGLIFEQLIALLALDDKLEDTINDAQNDYAAMTDLADAIAESYKVTVYAAKIPAAFKLADAWYDAYINPAEGYGFNFGTTYTGFLTEAEYNAITAKNEEYETLVEAAIADAESLKTALNAIDATLNVYSYGKISAALDLYNAFLTTYELTADEDGQITTNDIDARLVAALTVEETTVTEAIVAKDNAYADLIDELEADAADIKDMLDDITGEYVYTIYSDSDVAAVRAAYDAWCEKAGMAKDDTAYTAEGLDETITAYEESIYDALVEAEGKVDALEAAKDAETEAVVELINGLASIGGADKVTVLNRAQIEAAKAAYDAWLYGDFNRDGEVTDSEGAVYAIDPANDRYVIAADVIASLEAYVNALGALDTKIEGVENLVDAIPEEVTADNLDAFKQAIADANAALNEYYAANGGNTDGIDAEVAGAVAEAEMKLAIYEAVASVKVDLESDGELSEDDLNTLAALEEELESVYKSYNDTFYAESEDPNAPLNQYNNDTADKADTYSAIAKNFAEYIKKNVLSKYQSTENTEQA